MCVRVLVRVCVCESICIRSYDFVETLYVKQKSFCLTELTLNIFIYFIIFVIQMHN